jgi:hypothetical protein
MTFLLLALGALSGSLAIYFIVESLDRRGAFSRWQFRGFRPWLGLLVGASLATLVGWVTGEISLGLETFAVFAAVDQLVRHESTTRRTGRRARKLVRVYVRITIDIEAGEPK